MKTYKIDGSCYRRTFWVSWVFFKVYECESVKRDGHPAHPPWVVIWDQLVLMMKVNQWQKPLPVEKAVLHFTITSFSYKSIPWFINSASYSIWPGVQLTPGPHKRPQCELSNINNWIFITCSSHDTNSVVCKIIVCWYSFPGCDMLMGW